MLKNVTLFVERPCKGKQHNEWVSTP